MSDTTRIVYGKSSVARDDRHQRALGERAVADVAALGPAHEAGLADRERREVVVVPVVLVRLEPEGVEAHLLLERAQRDGRQRLRLPAREERGAVRARQDAGLDRRSTGSRRSPRPSGRFFSTAMRWRMTCFSSRSKASCARWRYSAWVSASASPEYWVSTASSTAFVAAWRSSLSTTWVASSSCAPWLERISLEQALVDLRGLDLQLLLADLLGQLALQGAELADLVVGDVERVEDLRLGDLVRAGLDHEDGLLGAGDDQVEVGVGGAGPPRGG